MDHLDDLIRSLFERPDREGRSLATVVLRSGEVIAEHYGTQPANDFAPEVVIDRNSTLISWSMAKSVTHAAIGLLVADGLLDVDDAAPVAAWAGTPKEQITVLDLLEMRSGLRFVEDYVDGDVSHCIEMLFGESGPSHASYAAALPLDHEPGTVWNYSSGTTNILAKIVGDVAHGATDGTPADREASMRRFLDNRLFGPIGLTSAEPKFDAAGTFVGSSFLYATARDFAEFGELYRRDGVTRDGQRILPKGWLDHARHPTAHDAESNLGYGRHWWTWPEFPGSLGCHGYEGQYTLVVPDREIVLVHLGKTDVGVSPLLRARLATIVDVAS